MSSGKYLTEEVKKKIVQLKNEGYRQKDIAERLGIHFSTVNKIK